MESQATASFEFDDDASWDGGGDSPRSEYGGTTPQDGLSKVGDRLFVGTFMSEQNMESLKAYKITHILQIGAELSPSHSESFQYLGVNIKDDVSEDLLGILRPCLHWMDAAIDSGGSVLVHCLAGVSRSPTMCCAYNLWKNQEGLPTCLENLLKAHPSADPNPRFLHQLEVFDNELHSDINALPDTALETIINRDLAPPSLDQDSDDDDYGGVGITADDWL